jgi:glucosamine 6-phosphate synthetase-like amidotransferase/phosphosugar isomerase protein
MCGLVGLLLHPGPRPAGAWEEIRAAVTANLLANEERGREAAGVVVVQEDGSYHLFKQPVPASALVRMPGYGEALRAIGPHTTCVLGHTRLPTKGSRWHNANNHPLLAGHVVGVHNGYIDNDDALFEELQLPRTAEVDSEVIFRLQDRVEPLGANGSYLPRLSERLALLEGRFTTLSVDTRAPGRLVVLKVRNPLSLHYEPTLRALLFSSRYVYLRKTFGPVVAGQMLSDQHAYAFDAGSLPRLGSEPAFRLPLP